MECYELETLFSNKTNKKYVYKPAFIGLARNKYIFVYTNNPSKLNNATSLEIYADCSHC